MNASPRPEVLSEAAPVREHRGKSSLEAPPPGAHGNEPNRPGPPGWPAGADEAAFPTFADGAGI
jgi:hypothetical protein